MDHEAIALEALRGEIAACLRSICAHIPAIEFENLVDRLAQAERSYKFVHDVEALSRSGRASAE